MNIKELAIFLRKLYKRHKDRGYKSNIKKDLEDMDDDVPNSKLKIQKDLEDLYTGKEFDAEKSFSRMMSTLFVIFMYSSGMPILYLVGAIFFAFTYLANKLLILKFYKKTSLQRTIPLQVNRFLKYSLILHMFCGLFMVTNPTAFETLEQSKSSGVFSFFLGEDNSLDQELEKLQEGASDASPMKQALVNRMKFKH